MSVLEHSRGMLHFGRHLGLPDVTPTLQGSGTAPWQPHCPTQTPLHHLCPGHTLATHHPSTVLATISERQSHMSDQSRQQLRVSPTICIKPMWVVTVNQNATVFTGLNHVHGLSLVTLAWAGTPGVQLSTGALLHAHRVSRHLPSVGP